MPNHTSYKFPAVEHGFTGRLYIYLGNLVEEAMCFVCSCVGACSTVHSPVWHDGEEVDCIIQSTNCFMSWKPKDLANITRNCMEFLLVLVSHQAEVGSKIIKLFLSTWKHFVNWSIIGHLWIFEMTFHPICKLNERLWMKDWKLK